MFNSESTPIVHVVLATTSNNLTFVQGVFTQLDKAIEYVEHQLGKDSFIEECQSMMTWQCSNTGNLMLISSHMLNSNVIEHISPVKYTQRPICDHSDDALTCATCAAEREAHAENMKKCDEILNSLEEAEVLNQMREKPVYLTPVISVEEIAEAERLAQIERDAEEHERQWVAYQELKDADAESEKFYNAQLELQFAHRVAADMELRTDLDGNSNIIKSFGVKEYCADRAEVEKGLYAALKNIMHAEGYDREKCDVCSVKTQLHEDMIIEVIWRYVHASVPTMSTEPFYHAVLFCTPYLASYYKELKNAEEAAFHARMDAEYERLSAEELGVEDNSPSDEQFDAAMGYNTDHAADEIAEYITELQFKLLEDNAAWLLTVERALEHDDYMKLMSEFAEHYQEYIAKPAEKITQLDTTSKTYKVYRPLSELMHVPTLINGRVGIHIDGQYSTFAVGQYCEVPENFDPKYYSLLETEKYSCIVFTSFSHQKEYYANKDLAAKQRRIKAGDKIHIRSRRGIYTVVSADNYSFTVTCDTWKRDPFQPDMRKYYNAEYLTHAGGRWN